MINLTSILYCYSAYPSFPYHKLKRMHLLLYARVTMEMETKMKLNIDLAVLSAKTHGVMVNGTVLKEMSWMIS